MITLYKFGPQWGLADASPFVVKVDLFLKVTGLDYEAKSSANYLRRAPKKKLPFITDGEETVGDSYFIVRFLSNKYKLTIDAHLTQEQHSQALLYSKALDESLYWCLIYSRWVCGDTWPIAKKAFFGDMPAILQSFVPRLLQKGVKKSLFRHGYGRHNETELHQIAHDHFSALSVLLGDKKYFFGDKISSFDTGAFALLAQFTLMPFNNRFNELARSHQNLIDYCQRIKQQYYLTP